MKTLLRLLLFLRPHWTRVGLSILLGVAAIGSGIGLMGASAFIIATAALQPSIAVLQVAIVSVRFFGISRGVFRYLERLVSHSLNFELLAHLRTWLFRALEPLAPGGLLNYRSGDVLTRIVADIDTLENFYVRAVAPPMMALIVILGVGWLVGTAHMGFVAILWAGLLTSGVLLPILAFSTSRKANQQAVSARAELTTMIVDGLQGSAELTLFDHQHSFLERLEQITKRSNRIQETLAWQNAGGNALNLWVTNLTLWGMVAMGIWCVSQGILDGVNLAVLALVTLASFEAVLPLTQAAQSLESSLEAGRRLFEIADQHPAVHFEEDGVQTISGGAIRFEEVSFRYRDSQDWVVNHIHFDLAEGEHAALIGPSGAGKTTLLHLIQRFWDPQEGEILLGGVDIRQLSGKALRSQVSLMTQQTYIFDQSLRQNLLLAKTEATDEALWQALAKARLEGWARSLPEGLDTWLGERGQKMSGGERQRLAICRLHLRDSHIVLLDEPTSHLDALTAREIQEILFTAFEQRTILWITHDQADLSRFDRILRLEGGILSEVNPRN